MPPLNPTQELRATLGGPQRLSAVLGSPQQLGTVLPSGPRGYSVDYAGIVERDGTMHGPNGWTIAHPSVGVYTITHNLNLDPLAYVVTGTPARGTLDPIDPGKASSIVTFVRDQQANYFVVAVVEGSPAGMAFVDAGFNFTLSPEMLAGDLIPGPPGPPGADSTVPGPPGAPGPAGPPMTVQDEGAALASYPVLNFAGAGVTATADAPASRITVTIPGAAAAPVASVFGRTGVVVAVNGDYTAAQVTNAVSVTASYADPAWITSLDWTKINNKPAIPNQTPWTQHIDGAGFELRNAGKVGIGTEAPGHKLSIDNGNFFMRDEAMDNALVITPASYTTGIGLVVRDYAYVSSKALLFNPGGGAVGIGTAQPTSKLSFGDTAPNITQRIALFETTAGGGFRGVGMANPSAGVWGVGVYASTVNAPTDTNMALFVRDGGRIAMQYLPSSNPGAGTKELYYDPADGNRVKFSA